jgi:hypothetical protein
VQVCKYPGKIVCKYARTELNKHPQKFYIQAILAKLRHVCSNHGEFIVASSASMLEEPTLENEEPVLIKSHA